MLRHSLRGLKMSIYKIPINYHFDKSNEQLLEHISFIFIFLKNYTSFLDKLDENFMNDIYLKRWKSVSGHLHKLKEDFRKYKKILEMNGLYYLELYEIYEILSIN